MITGTCRSGMLVTFVLALIACGVLVLLGNTALGARHLFASRPPVVAVPGPAPAAPQLTGSRLRLMRALALDLPAARPSGTFSARAAIFENSAQGLALTVTQAGARFRLAHGATLGIRLVAVRSGGRFLPLTNRPPIANKSRIEVTRARGLTEWFANTPRGIEQGFTFKRRPVGSATLTELRLVLEGPLVPALDHGTLRFTDGARRTVLRYGDLVAYDAHHRQLPARLSLRGRTLRLSVDTRHAVYPVTIDPLFSVSNVVTEPTPAANHEFGYAVALSADGSVALIGSPSTPAAYVFIYSKSAWSPAATLSDPGTSTSDKFAQAVALSADGTKALIGAPGANQAYLYSSSSGAWSTTAAHTFSDPQGTASGDNFGASVALSADGSTVLIGAYDATAYTPVASTKSPVSSAGRAYAYSSANWGDPAVFQEPTPAENNLFGFSVALASGGDTALIGAPDTAVPDPTSNSAPALAAAGVAYVFSYSSGKWNLAPPKASLTEPIPAGNDRFGYAVSLSSDGSAGLVSAPFAAVSTSGAAVDGAGKVYRYAGGTWSSPTEFDNPTVGSAGGAASGANENFGFAVALSPDDAGAMIGAPGAVINVPSGGTAPAAVYADAGKAYAYSVARRSWPPQAGSLATPQTFWAPGETSNNQFASSVAIAAVSSAPVPAVNGLAGGYLLSVTPPSSTTTLASAGAVLALYTGIDLQLTMTATSSPVPPGGSIAYDFTVTNTDPDLTASKVMLTDVLAAGLAYSSANGSGGNCTSTSGTVTCMRTALGPNATWQPSITVKAPSARTVVANSAAVSADQRDQVALNDTASVNTAVAQAPTASSSALTAWVSGSGQLNGSVEAGETAGYSLTTPAAHGTVVVNSNGSYIYTASPAYLSTLSAVCGGGSGSSGTDSFQFEVSDGLYTSSPATVSVTIWPGPTACPLSGIVTHGTTPASGQLNGLDPDSSQTLTYGVVTQPGHGALTVRSSGTFTYTPSGNYSGPDSFTFSVTDAHGNSSTAAVSITDYAAPTVNNGAFTLHGATSNTPLVLTGSEPDATQIPTITVIQPGHGTVTLGKVSTNSGTFSVPFTYAATDPGYTGSDSFTFTAKDAYNTSNTATVTLTVYTPPVANDGTVIAHVNASGAVTAQESDPTQQLTYKVTSQPAHGSLMTFNKATGAFTYQAKPGYTGPDRFQFNASDKYATSNTATVSITNYAAPAASNGSLTVHVAGSGQLTASDPDSRQKLNYALVKQPSHGSVTLNGTTGAYIYRANAGYSGTDSFTFNARDSYNSSNTGTVEVTVYAGPTANPARRVAHVNVSGTLSASDPDSTQSLTYKIVQPPQHGTVKLDAGSGAYTYSANAGYTGPDSFSFNARDRYSTSNTAAVSVTVFAAPTAADGTLAVHGSASGKLSAADPDGKQTLSYVIVSNPAHGKVSLDAATGAYTYTANAGFTGDDSFTFEARDDYNASNTATLKLTVYGPPVASNVALTAAVNATASGQLKATDLDPSQTLVYAVVSPPARGTLSLNGTTGGFIYRPAAGYSGSDSFTYVAKDAYAESNTASVAITVAAASGSSGNSGANGPPAPVAPGGGGAFGWLGLLLLGGMAGLRRRRR